jgi:hypothetical protein
MVRKLRAHFRQQFVGYLALFVALGGSAYAAATIGPANIQNDAVRSRHIKDGQVKNPDLAANSVGTGKVIDGSLLKQDFKAGQLSAMGPASGDLTGNYPSPTLKPSEGWHEVGTTGEPAFQNSWQNSGGNFETVAFYKDREGVVHLKGSATGPNNMIIFQLPAGYRPASGKQLEIAAVCNCTTVDSDATPTAVNVRTGQLQIFGSFNSAAIDGGVSMSPSPSAASFDGVTFRAAS